MRPGADLLIWQDLRKLLAANVKEILQAAHLVRHWSSQQRTEHTVLVTPSGNYGNKQRPLLQEQIQTIYLGLAIERKLATIACVWQRLKGKQRNGKESEWVEQKKT